MVGWAEMPRSPGVFYDRLQSVLIEGGFDGYGSYYAARLGAPSVPPGRYFRMHLVGYRGHRSAGWNGAARIPCRYGSFYGWKAGIVCRTIPGCHGPARACPMRSTRRSSTGFWL